MGLGLGLGFVLGLAQPNPTPSPSQVGRATVDRDMTWDPEGNAAARREVHAALQSRRLVPQATLGIEPEPQP